MATGFGTASDHTTTDVPSMRALAWCHSSEVLPSAAVTCAHRAKPCTSLSGEVRTSGTRSRSGFLRFGWTRFGRGVAVRCFAVCWKSTLTFEPLRCAAEKMGPDHGRLIP